MSKIIVTIAVIILFASYIGLRKGVYNIPQAIDRNVDWKQCLVKGGSLQMLPSTAADYCLPKNYDSSKIN